MLNKNWRISLIEIQNGNYRCSISRHCDEDGSITATESANTSGEAFNLAIKSMEKELRNRIGWAREEVERYNDYLKELR